MEAGGHVLGTHQVWVRSLHESAYAHEEGNIPQRVRQVGHQYSDQIRDYEDLITASAVYVKERIRTNSWISRASPKEVKIRMNNQGKLTTAELSFFIPFDAQDPRGSRLLASRLHYWKEGNEMRLETQSLSARFYQNGMKMVVQELQIDGYNNIILEARMDSDQVWVAKDRAPKIYKT